MATTGGYTPAKIEIRAIARSRAVEAQAELDGRSSAAKRRARPNRKRGVATGRRTR